MSDIIGPIPLGPIPECRDRRDGVKQVIPCWGRGISPCLTSSRIVTLLRDRDVSVHHRTGRHDATLACDLSHFIDGICAHQI
jgi:hypothetical protein